MPTAHLPGLRDIHGMPPAPWWPPAPGWWLVAAAILLVALAIWKWRHLVALRVPLPAFGAGAWRQDAASELTRLRRRARAGEDAKTIAGAISELLRRIAMARFGRAACAGLTGAAWLEWLSRRDPNAFPWHERGRVLISAPYGPPSKAGGTLSDAGLIELIDAALAWTRVRDPAGPDRPAADTPPDGPTARQPLGASDV